MSISLVIQVYEEVRRLAIAGSVVAGGDFRLKKLVEPLKKSAEKAPIFGKIAEAAEKLLTSAEKESASSLLELGVLVNAVLYTQGETGLDGEVVSVESRDLGVHTTQASARILKPLLEALSTTGAGRLEIIRDAQTQGSFRDLRLVNPALKALDDPYAEIADLVADEILPIYGTAILPELRAAFKTPGKMGDARRLRLMYRLDPRGTRDLVELALEEGSKELGVAAIECLGDSPEDLPHLLEHANAKAKDVRAAALQGLARCRTDEAILAIFKKALAGKDLEIAVSPICGCRDPLVVQHVVSDAQSQFSELFKLKDKAKLALALERFNLFLGVFEGRDDVGTQAVLMDCFENRDALCGLKGNNVSGSDVYQAVVRLMAISNLPKCHEALAAQIDSLEPEVLTFAIIGMSRVRQPAEMFEALSPLLIAKGDGKKKKSVSAQKREQLEEYLQHLLDDDEDASYYHYRLFRRVFGGRQGFTSGKGAESSWAQKSALDPRWLDVAVEAGNVNLVCSLARSGHQGCAAFLERALAAAFDAKDKSHDAVKIVSTMLRIGHSAGADSLIAAIKNELKKKSAYHHTYWLTRLIPQLPLTAIAKIEEMLPTLPERTMDEILPYLQILKEQAKAAT